MNVRHLSHTLPAFLKMTLLVALVVAIAGIALARRSIFPSKVGSSASVSAGKSQALTAVTAQRPRAIANIEAELVTVTPHGFEPQQITRPSGPFLLMLDNRSGLRQANLRLSLEAGAQLREVPVPREQPDWSEVIALPPGRYVLTEADHPRWLCRLTITAP